MAVYNDQVRLHSVQDQAFVEHLNAWTRQVDAYAQCEVNTLNAENEFHRDHAGGGEAP